MIEFIRGEEYCRWNGTLMNPENYMKLFGIKEENEPIIEKEFIEAADVVYSDLCFGDLFKLLIKINSTHRGKEPEYDLILSQGYGLSRHCEREAVECSYIIKEDVVESFSGIKVKPYKAFKKDYPKFNEKKFLEFQDDLNDYYDSRQYLK